MKNPKVGKRYIKDGGMTYYIENNVVVRVLEVDESAKHAKVQDLSTSPHMDGIWWVHYRDLIGNGVD